MFCDKNSIFEFRGPWGVPVQIGGSILFLIFFLIDFSSGPKYLMYDLMFVLILFASILLHELGHAWGCLIQGVPVTRIMLYGGGGFCERRVSASRNQQELIVAMGPIVNLVLWAVASLTAPMISDPEIGWVIDTIAWTNLFLAVFNLIPVHPLDGGKLFELLLLRLMPPSLAIRISGAVGFLLAILWIPAMILSYWTIGLFLIFVPPILMHWNMARHASP